MKIRSHQRVVEFISRQIVEKKASPAVVAHRMKAEDFGCTLGMKTIDS